MAAQLFIVARSHPELYDYLTARFAEDAGVAVVLDRRLAPRRRRSLPAAAERRRADRRARPDVDEQLRATSLAVVTASMQATAAPPPTSEARHWVETMQRGVTAVRRALDDHERLQREMQAIEHDHAQLEHEARALAQENARLRGEIDRSRRELTELDASIRRAIDVVTDLQSRLSKDPAADPRP
jgi:predicted  nucleic acid-binding Zn-ribbon protein